MIKTETKTVRKQINPQSQHFTTIREVTSPPKQTNKHTHTNTVTQHRQQQQVKSSSEPNIYKQGKQTNKQTNKQNKRVRAILTTQNMPQTANKTKKTINTQNTEFHKQVKPSK